MRKTKRPDSPNRPRSGRTIRPACPDDVGAIARLAEEFAQWMRELGDHDSLQLNAAAIERDGFGPHPAFEGLVAESNGEVVGYLLHHPGYDTDAACRLVFVVDLFVTRLARGAGCGTALIDGLRVIAVRRGARQLVWTVDRRNVGALRFYARLGARPVDALALMSMDV